MILRIFPFDFFSPWLANHSSLVLRSNHRHHTRTNSPPTINFPLHCLPQPLTFLSYSFASLFSLVFFPEDIAFLHCATYLFSSNPQRWSLYFSSGIWARLMIVQWIRCVCAYTFYMTFFNHHCWYPSIPDFFHIHYFLSPSWKLKERFSFFCLASNPPFSSWM